jgi:hypothetical protein
MRLSPPCPERGFKTQDEAFAGGFDYAKAAIDGAFRVSTYQYSDVCRARHTGPIALSLPVWRR